MGIVKNVWKERNKGEHGETEIKYVHVIVSHTTPAT